MHRKPADVALQARALLGYLKATADWGLHYEKCDGEASFGDMGELKYQSLKHVEAYSDASFAPVGEQFKSVQGTIVAVAGCAVLWSSSRQPFVSGSTAEAELLSYMECHQQAEGVASLLECLTRSDVQRCVYGDNRSALSLCMGDVGAWRTRHLRLRAAGLRSAVACAASAGRCTMSKALSSLQMA